MQEVPRTSESTQEEPPLNLRNVGAWSGVVGAVLFVTVFSVEGWLRAGYDPATMFVSALSLGPRGWIQIANFLVAGFLLLMFSRGVAAQFRNGISSRSGPILLGIVGLSLLASGPFVMDPATTSFFQMSVHGKLHAIFGALFFTMAPASCFIFFRRFRTEDAWRILQWWTLAAGGLMVAADLLLKFDQISIVLNGHNMGVGLVQRAAIVSYMAWIAVVGLTMLSQRT